MLYDNSEYSITRDNEVATLLSHFGHDFIYNVVNKSLEDRIRSYSMDMPNIVVSYEQNFKNMIDIYPLSQPEILATRQTTYEDIIKTLCDYYQLVYDDSDTVDLYSSTVCLYELLVSNFQNNIVDFFANYIIQEKNTIYDLLNFSILKKNKDSSTVYSKKVYKNTRLGIVCANLDAVIDNIAVFDIDFNIFLSMVYNYDRRNMIPYIQSLVSPKEDFFKTYITPWFQSNMRPILLTSIRLKLQELLTDCDLNMNNITKGE